MDTVDLAEAVVVVDSTPQAHRDSTLQVPQDFIPQVHPGSGLQARLVFNPEEFSPVVFDPRAASDLLALWALDRARLASAPLDHAQPVSGHFHPPEERWLGQAMLG